MYNYKYIVERYWRKAAVIPDVRLAVFAMLHSCRICSLMGAGVNSLRDDGYRRDYWP
jgi:hypothetical protein